MWYSLPVPLFQMQPSFVNQSKCLLVLIVQLELLLASLPSNASVQLVLASLTNISVHQQVPGLTIPSKCFCLGYVCCFSECFCWARASSSSSSKWFCSSSSWSPCKCFYSFCSYLSANNLFVPWPSVGIPCWTITKSVLPLQCWTITKSVLPLQLFFCRCNLSIKLHHYCKKALPALIFYNMILH